MDPTIMGIAVGALVALVGFLITYLSGKKMAAAAIAEAESRAKLILDDAEKKGEGIRRTKIEEADDKFRELKRKAEADRDAKDAKLRTLEKEIRKREEGIDQKLEVITKKEKQVATLEAEVTKKAQQIDSKTKEIDVLLEEQNMRLERITGMSREDAKKFLVDNMVNEAKAS
ncbi:MAG TPA: Rnase Y domain-containing protein, partial [Candidatus Didemnitutus sp.]|nr:Rnase Y domain-containing protein [Candidatus Didemnitutus sp.]